MKISKNWMLTELAGGYVAVPVGENIKNFNGIIKLNETGKDIWNALAEGLDEEAIAERLVGEYEGLDREKALEDVRKIVAKLRSEGLIEE